MAAAVTASTAGRVNAVGQYVAAGHATAEVFCWQAVAETGYCADVGTSMDEKPDASGELDEHLPDDQAAEKKRDGDQDEPNSNADAA